MKKLVLVLSATFSSISAFANEDFASNEIANDEIVAQTFASDATGEIAALSNEEMQNTKGAMGSLIDINIANNANLNVDLNGAANTIRATESLLKTVGHGISKVGEKTLSAAQVAGASYVGVNGGYVAGKTYFSEGNKMDALGYAIATAAHKNAEIANSIMDMF